MKTTIPSPIPAAAKLAKTTLLTFGAAALFSASILAQDPAQPVLPLPPASVSTVPSNGDVNPYGVAFVPNQVPSGGKLNPGDILVSNFNNNQNLQGTGTTIVDVSQTGQVSLFYQGPAGLGLTAALGITRKGLVFVGNLPTADGTSATVQPGSLLVLNRKGVMVGYLADPALINGPWGLALHDEGDGAQVFISNVLAGTVVRLDLAFSADGDSVFLRSAVKVASGYNHRVDPAALVLGPSGLHYDADNDILYVASSADNAIYALQGAGVTDSSLGTGNVIYQDNTHLHGPLDLVSTPNGDLIVANSDGSNVDPNQPSELVEFTLAGKFVAQFPVDKANGGAFGIGIRKIGKSAIQFAAVDDDQNTLTIWTKPIN